jgi:hypothetical protein
MSFIVDKCKVPNAYRYRQKQPKEQILEWLLVLTQRKKNYMGIYINPSLKPGVRIFFYLCISISTTIMFTLLLCSLFSMF